MSTFVYPIAPAPHADPWVLYHEGAYYYCFSRGGNSLCVAKAGRLCDIGRAEPVCVYTAPEGTLYSKSYWAPELHCIGGVWVIVPRKRGSSASMSPAVRWANAPQAVTSPVKSSVSVAMPS